MRSPPRSRSTATGTDTLLVDDTGDTLANTGTLTSTGLTGLGMGAGITYGSLEYLTVSLGAGADTFTIQSTHAGTTTVNGNVGNKFINIQRISGATIINAGTGYVTINVGSLAPTTLNGINGLLIVRAGADNDTLNVDDSGDDGAVYGGEMTAARITGLGMVAGDTSKGICLIQDSALSPGAMKSRVILVFLQTFHLWRRTRRGSADPG